MRMIHFSLQAIGPLDSFRPGASELSTLWIKMSMRKWYCSLNQGDMLNSVLLGDDAYVGVVECFVRGQAIMSSL